MIFNDAVRGTHLRGLQAVGAAGVGHVMVVGLPHPLASSTMCSNGRSVMRLGKVEAARRVEGRCGVGSAWRGLKWGQRRARVAARVLLFVDHNLT
jgi:hypothetical protein